MKGREELIEQLERGFSGDPWHGPPALAQIEGVDAARAATRPPGGAHSMWEIVLHATAWTREVTRRLEGAEPAAPTEGDWPPVAGVSAESWRATIERWRAAHVELVSAIGRVPEARFAETVGSVRDPALGSGTTHRAMILGLVQHDAYHSGQLALLRRWSAAPAMPGGSERIELRGERCTVRSWREDDLAALVGLADDRRIWANLRDHFPHPYTADDGRRWIAFAAGEAPQTNFAIDVGGTPVGGIGLELGRDIERCGAEIGYWIGADHWGRGLATEAVTLVTDYAFTRLGLCRVFAAVFEHNAASSRVLEKAGYSREGRLRKSARKDGKLLDQWLYAKVRDE